MPVVLTLTADTASTGTINWAKIITTGAASVSAYFELRDVATNLLYNRTGIASSLSTMSRFVIPRVRNVASGLDVGFAVVNTGSTSANITLTVRDQGGVVLGTKTYTLAAGNHKSAFPFQEITLADSTTATSYGYLSFESTSASFAATALAIEGGALSSFPVEVLQ